VLTAALVTIGTRPVARLACWLPAVLLAWLVAPSVTASGYFAMTFSRGPRSAALVQEYLSAAGQMWRQAVEPGRRPLASWVAALVVAGVLAWVLDRRRHRSQSAGTAVPDPVSPTLVSQPVDRPRSDTSSAAWP
jgi:hypothetical protein